ncbi:MAG TPA: ABC transporter permease [Myxococcaceae bacterium]|nr:ABC transporter permease [Myxococcaceae bacterium]
MRAMWLIARRELASYLRTLSGYVIIALVLFLLSLVFNAAILSNGEQRSSEVLSDYFRWASFFTVVVGLLLSMRLLAEEQQSGTVALLYSSPVREVEVVMGKYLSALAFLGLFLATTLFMPGLIMVHGKISFGHLFAGYLGLLLIGSASVAIGTLGSALAKSQVVAIIVSGVMAVALTMTWMLASKTERPFSDVLSAMALWNQHYTPFMAGIIHVRDIVYYLVVTYLGLFASTRVLEARRWR